MEGGVGNEGRSTCIWVILRIWKFLLPTCFRFPLPRGGRIPAKLTFVLNAFSWGEVECGCFKGFDHAYVSLRVFISNKVVECWWISWWLDFSFEGWVCHPHTLITRGKLAPFYEKCKCYLSVVLQGEIAEMCWCNL